jgi:condensin-2 complex subunit D3
MPDEDRIGVTARIAKDVLGGALSDGGILHAVCSSGTTPTEGDRDHTSAFNVLSDAFAILSSPLLRIGKGSNSSDDDQEDIADPNAVANPARRVVVAKGKLLSKISLKHLIEIVIPILRNLKALLQKSCSPLTKDLMHYMVHIYRSYKREVKEVLSIDAALLQEIEFEARRRKSKSIG